MLAANELGYWPTTQYVYDNDNIYNFKPLIIEGQLHVNRRSSRRDIEPIADPAETLAALGYSLNPAKVKVIDDVEVPSWLIPR